MEYIIKLILFVAFVFLFRTFGPWMLRIDEVIDLQKQILNELKIRNSKQERVEFNDKDDENIEMD